jgi:hypothetical protein
MIDAFARLKAFSNLKEQRNSQIRHPVHFEASTLIGGPFLRVTNISISLLKILLIYNRQSFFVVSLDIDATPSVVECQTRLL